MIIFTYKPTISIYLLIWENKDNFLVPCYPTFIRYVGFYILIFFRDFNRDLCISQLNLFEWNFPSKSLPNQVVSISYFNCIINKNKKMLSCVPLFSFKNNVELYAFFRKCYVVYSEWMYKKVVTPVSVVSSLNH